MFPGVQNTTSTVSNVNNVTNLTNGVIDCIRGRDPVIAGVENIRGGLEQCGKLHKVSIISRFGARKGVLHYIMSPQRCCCAYIVLCEGGGPGHLIVD